ncbi:ArnT family glycosyltransferase [Algoriphagus algorifonticola]|uniref:ArnT family glycosyltransferase n=1 Tax=Algoriphagus algorifonticola TaxID=2593007 RepID=UPI0011A2FD16|nr:glycosyltransferase family 39 protein [Algoriphagus algorifonticola]
MRKDCLILTLVIITKFILQLIVVHPDFELHRDEFLHLDQADHLAWGYLSVPPFTSWNSVLIRWLGNTEFWVRFFPAFYGALTIWVIWKLVGKLGGDLFAKSLSAVALLCSALIRLNILYQPNSVDILCWTLVFYFLVKLIRDQDPSNWYGIALCFALGFLNKYSIAFLGLGLLLGILATPQRKLLGSKQVFYAILIFILLISPNFLWQWKNGWPVLTHMDYLNRYQLANNSRIGFLMEQLLFFYPSLFIWIIGFGALAFLKKFRDYRLIPWTFILTLVLFTFFKAKAYYAIGLYPVIVAFGAFQLSEFTRNSSLFKQVIRQNLLRSALLILPIGLFFPAVPLIHPFYSPERVLNSPPAYSKLGLNRWEDGKEYPLPQDFADMLGWKEMANIVDEAFAQMPEKGRKMVICTNYGQAGAINFYTQTPGLKAFTMNADYLYWFDLEEPVDHLILVRSDFEKLTEEEINFFEEHRLIGTVNHPLAREKETSVHYLRGAKIPVNPILQEEIREEKKMWEREGN